MNVKTSNITFDGKREVISNLNKAAKYARYAEVNRALSHYDRKLKEVKEWRKYKELLKAHMEIAVADNKFVDILKDFVEKTEIPSFASFLVNEKVSSSHLKTFELFRRVMTNSIKSQKKVVEIGLLRDFFKKVMPG